MQNNNLQIMQHLNTIISYMEKQNHFLDCIQKKLSMPMRNNHWEDSFYTVKEVAKILRKHPCTIRRRIANGKLEASKSNNGKKQDHYLIPKNVVRKMIHDAGGNTTIC